MITWEELFEFSNIYATTSGWTELKHWTWVVVLHDNHSDKKKRFLLGLDRLQSIPIVETKFLLCAANLHNKISDML